MTIPIALILGLAAYSAIRALHSISQERAANREEVAPTEPDTPDFYQERKPPRAARLKCKLKNLRSTRHLFQHEVSLDSFLDEKYIEYRFYAPRRVVDADLIVSAAEPLDITDIAVSLEGETKSDPVYVEITNTSPYTYRFLMPRLGRIDSLKLLFGSVEQNLDFKGNVRILKLAPGEYRDLSLIDSCIAACNRGEYQLALELCKEYEAMVNRSPYAYLTLSEIHNRLKHRDEAEIYALKAALNGLYADGIANYSKFLNDRVFLDDAEIRRLEEKADSWAIPNHYGFIGLLNSTKHRLGIDQYYLTKVCKIVKLRRTFAARLFRTFTFDFDSPERLLLTRARILRADGGIKVLEKEFLTQQDKLERNLFVTTSRESSANWILPDLNKGDIVEIHYHTFGRELSEQKDSARDFFVRDHLTMGDFPIFSGRVEYTAPSDFKIKFDTTSDKITRDESAVENASTRSYVFGLNSYIPSPATGFNYEYELARPIVAGAGDGLSWQDITRTLVGHNLGTTEIDDSLPEPLAGMIANSGSPEEALRSAFHWTRDKLKYAALRSALRQIGQPGRASTIVQSGVADCKDKSYLLYQVCRKLGIEADYLAVQTTRGRLYQDLPSDQFDHVMVHARIDGKNKYLDATSSESVFGSAPLACQGMQGLILDGSGTIITIEIDDPETNTIKIIERLHTFDGDWLSGDFRIIASGNSGRLADEGWKSLSLHGSSQLEGAQMFVQNLMPSIVVLSYAPISETSLGGIFEAEGEHKRCHLSKIGNRDVGTVDWHSPMMSLDAWRHLEFGELFAFPIREKISIDLTIEGDLPARLAGVSEQINFDNNICRIESRRDQFPEALRIRTTIITKQKFVRDDDIALLPDTMAYLDRALQTVLAFKNEE